MQEKNKEIINILFVMFFFLLIVTNLYQAAKLYSTNEQINKLQAQNGDLQRNNAGTTYLYSQIVDKQNKELDNIKQIYPNLFEDYMNCYWANYATLYPQNIPLMFEGVTDVNKALAQLRDACYNFTSDENKTLQFYKYSVKEIGG